jgi:DNA-binding NarL/FixJ family response regulator
VRGAGVVGRCEPWDDGVVAWTILIVDDHAGFRASARALLEADGFDVIGEAADGKSAVEQARRLRPQVVLLDIQLPEMDGFAVAERLAAEPAAPAVVLISSRGRGAFRGRLETTPARGFITKAEFSGECLSSLLA